jgi:uncharacterized membrane protein YvlD (DUF360 family)
MALVIKILLTALGFLVVSKILSGFHVRSFKTAVVMAVVYSILLKAAEMAALPLAIALAGFFIGILAFVPVIGPVLAASAILPATLAFMFLGVLVSAVVLKVTDALLEDFEMEGIGTAFWAVLLLGLYNMFMGIIF